MCVCIYINIMRGKKDVTTLQIIHSRNVAVSLISHAFSELI